MFHMSTPTNYPISGLLSAGVDQLSEQPFNTSEPKRDWKHGRGVLSLKARSSKLLVTQNKVIKIKHLYYHVLTIRYVHAEVKRDHERKVEKNSRRLGA